MAFFGLTALGAQSAFQASALVSMAMSRNVVACAIMKAPDIAQDFLDITLITDEELESAFQRCDKDGSGAIEIGEVRALPYSIGPFRAQFPHSPLHALLSLRPC